MHASQIFIIAFFTSVVTATSTVFVVQRVGMFEEKTDAVMVPSLKGLSEEDARRNLEASGLVMMVAERKPSEDAEPGSVIGQIPLPGQSLGKGSAVTLTLAESLPSVPDVAGQAPDEATLVLEQAGYKVVRAEPVPHESIPAGKVVSQFPKAGDSLHKGKSVTIRVSSGRAEQEVPKVTGLNVASAKKNLEEAGFKLGKVTWVYDEDLWPNAVVRQDPEPKSKAAVGSEVTLVVNRE